MIYLDNASTTALAPEVQQVLQEAFNYYGNPGSNHRKGREAAEHLAEARATIAKTINAQPEEIIFTSGATESNNLALLGTMLRQEKTASIITSSIEHPSIKEPVQWLGKQGYTTTFLPVTQEGIITTEQLAKALTKNTHLISIIHGNHEIGTLQNIKELSKEKGNALLHIDATQSYTKIPINVKQLNIDLLTISSHKIHGPKGIGALYIKEGTKLQPLMKGGGQEHTLRPGTENLPGIIGLATAAQLGNKEGWQTTTQKLRDTIIKQLLTINNSQLNGSQEERLCNNINVSFPGKQGDSIALQLSNKNIMISTGATCTTAKQEPSYILKALGRTTKEIQGSIRISLSRYTTKQELEEVLPIIIEVINHT